MKSKLLGKFTPHWATATILLTLATLEQQCPHRKPLASGTACRKDQRLSLYVTGEKSGRLGVSTAEKPRIP